MSSKHQNHTDAHAYVQQDLLIYGRNTKLNNDFLNWQLRASKGGPNLHSRVKKLHPDLSNEGSNLSLLVFGHLVCIFDKLPEIMCFGLLQNLE